MSKVSLREHLTALRKADQEAIKVLAANFEGRMTNTNEWRATVESLINVRATIQQFEQLKEQFDKLEARVNANANKIAGVMQMVAIGSGVLTIAGVVVGIIYTIGG